MGLGLIILFSLAFYGVLGIITFGVAILGIKKIFLLSDKYLQKSYKSALKKLFQAFIFSIPFALYLFSIFSRKDLSYNLILALFIFSSFFGFSIFVIFIKSIQQNKLLEIFKSLMVGGFIALFFIPSGYFTFKPIVEYVMVTKDGIIYGSFDYFFLRNSDYEDENITSLFTESDSAGERELKVRRYNLEKESYNHFLNMPPSPYVKDVKLDNFYEDFLTTASDYHFTYKATPQYFEFLANHKKYPKKDPKNVPVHKVSCSDYRTSKDGDECYFGVLYPYFHNIIYTPSTQEVKHAIGYYVW